MIREERFALVDSNDRVLATRAEDRLGLFRDAYDSEPRVVEVTIISSERLRELEAAFDVLNDSDFGKPQEQTLASDLETFKANTYGY